MLRKRTRSHQKDQHTNNSMACAIPSSYFHSDISNQNCNNSSFLNVPSLFAGSSRKNSDSSSSTSPTSPLDFRIFSGFGNPFRRPRTSPSEGSPRSWDCHKVGLSIIDSLDKKDKQPQLGNVCASSDNKNILFGRQMSIGSNPGSHANFVEILKALPENISVLPYSQAKSADVRKGNSNVVFEIGEATPESGSENFQACSLDSGRFGSSITNSVPWVTKNLILSEPRFHGGSLESGCSSKGKLSSIPFPVHSGTCFIGSVPRSEIELSEDYTCVVTHGPNPKVTHIFGDCILECHSDQALLIPSKSEDDDASPKAGGPTNICASLHSNDFLKSCYTCHKKLDGQDIYMYRGEKAFCSYNCRSQEIEVDEDMEITDSDTSETPYA